MGDYGWLVSTPIIKIVFIYDQLKKVFSLIMISLIMDDYPEKKSLIE